MICEKCGMELSNDMKFCPSCGTAVLKSTELSHNHLNVCRRCGTLLLPDARFCKKCGAPVQTLPPLNHQQTQKTVNFVKEKEQVQTRKKRSIWHVVISIILVIALVGVFLFYSSGHTAFEQDNGSSYNNRYRYTVMELWKSDNSDSILIDSEENIISLNASNSYISYIGDNGVAAGISYEQLSDGTFSDNHILFIIKDGQYIEITNKLDGNSDMVFQLCGSGKKLFYRETDEKIYSYDTEIGTSSEIHEGTYIDVVSYDGNVVTFNDSYCKIGDKSVFWGSPFANYVGVSDSGKNVYFNEAYTTTSGDDESHSVDFAVIDASSYKYDHNLPAPHTINESESIYTWITAHNTDYSEILFEYDGDTYYYDNKRRSKALICNNALLYPVEGIRSNRYLDQDDSLIADWRYHKSIDDSPSISSYFDPVHSVDTIKNHVYFKYNDDEKTTISLVYLCDDLKCQMLVEDVTADPVISNDGNYIWAISGNEIYRIDMIGREPKYKSINVNGLSWYNMDNNDYSWSLPIALCDDGKSAYCIGELFESYENHILAGTLFYVNMNEDSLSTIDDDVARCMSDGRDSIYYLNNDSPELETGSLYSYSRSQGKKQITTDVHNMYLINSDLFVIKPSEQYSSNYNLYKLERDLFHLVADNIKNVHYWQN